jgi:hypothetical protein
MELVWDQVGQKVYETGVDRGVLYLPNLLGVYAEGYAWNGLTTVTESPSGAESNKQYADNQVYLNLVSAEEFGGTVEAFTYPDEFAECDGSLVFEGGILVGQQSRRSFGFSYRTRVGNDLQGADFGYKLHLVYNALAAPSERAYATINDSPEALTFSWEFSTTPVAVGTINGTFVKPTSSLTIDSTKVDADTLAELEDILYGTAGTDARLPTPAEVLGLFAGTVVEVAATSPTYNATTKVITIPAVTGVTYQIDGADVAAGPQAPITADTVVTARPNTGYTLADGSDDDWAFDFEAA